MLAFKGPAQRSGVELAVAQMEVGAAVDDELDHGLVAVDRSPMQPRSAEEAAAVDVGALVEEKLGHGNVSVAAGDVEGLRDEFAVAFRRRRFDVFAVAEVA